MSKTEALAVRVHRGTHEIGGTCIEMAAGGQRLVLDAGMPMTPPRRGADLLPDVPGLWAHGDDSLRGLVISHPHPDHYGLADLVDPAVPIYLGERAQAVLRESAFFIPWAPKFPPASDLRDREPVEMGPFTVTPWLVDHGAQDCFALLVECAGRRILYSGDWRGHGANAHLLDSLVDNVGPLDVLLIEGTRMNSSGDEHAAYPSETAVEDGCAELCEEAPNAVVAFASAQNLDRLDTLQRAATRAGRELVLDLYAASLWLGSGRPRDQIRVYVTKSQRRRIIEAEAFERLRFVRDLRVFPEDLVERANELMLALRTSALRELEDLGLLLDADVIWSMWSGYLAGDAMVEPMRQLRRNGVLVHCIHTSGHAKAADIERLVLRLGARQVVPVHTRSAHVFARTLPGVVLRRDGEWWSA
jgi:ribonuclease J